MSSGRRAGLPPNSRPEPLCRGPRGVRMRKLFVTEFVSLDGVMRGTGRGAHPPARRLDLRLLKRRADGVEVRRDDGGRVAADRSRHVRELLRGVARPRRRVRRQVQRDAHSTSCASTSTAMMIFAGRRSAAACKLFAGRRPTRRRLSSRRARASFPADECAALVTRASSTNGVVATCSRRESPGCASLHPLPRRRRCAACMTRSRGSRDCRARTRTLNSRARGWRVADYSTRQGTGEYSLGPANRRRRRSTPPPAPSSRGRARQ